jgi:hypothetical protein
MQHLARPQVVLGSSTTFARFLQPLENVLPRITPLKSKSNRPITFHFKDEIKALIYYHLQDFASGCALVLALQEEDFARTHIAPSDGMPKSTFFEAVGSRGLEQCKEVFSQLAQYASAILPKMNAELGKLVVVDPTLIDCTLDMEYADYRDNCNKMQAPIGFDPHRSIPRGFDLITGKANTREYVLHLVQREETGVFDRGFQCYADFDSWDSHGVHYVCRIKNSPQKTVLRSRPVLPGGKVVSDEDVILGDSQNCTRTPVRLVVFRVGRKFYTIATNRFDLTAEQIAKIYRLRWAIEVFFGWWKRFMKVYHLISRTRNGLAVQLLSGLITYLLLAIYCHEQFGETVTIKRLRELQHDIRNESMCVILILLMLHPLFLYRYAKS